MNQRLLAVGTLLVLLVPEQGWAQTAEDKAAAEVLFDEARTLMQEKQYALACPKFAESNRLDTGIGTVLWLADCYEKNGQSASAWAEFREAQDLASKNRDPRERVAKERADHLQPMLSKMTVMIANPGVSGLVVKRDKEQVGKSQWGVAVPVDPGPHKMTVTAPNKKAWETSVFVPAGVNVDVSVPALKDLPPPPPGMAVGSETTPGTNESRHQDAPSGGGGQRAVGGALMGLGLAGVGAGTVLTIIANQSLATASQGDCGGRCKSEQSQDLVQGQNETIGAAISFAGGGALLVTGLIVILTAPSGAAKAAKVSVAPWFRPGAGGVGLGGTFE